MNAATSENGMVIPTIKLPLSSLRNAMTTRMTNRIAQATVAVRLYTDRLMKSEASIAV